MVLVIPSLHLSETFWLTMPHEGSIGAMASSRKGVEAKMKRQELHCSCAELLIPAK